MDAFRQREEEYELEMVSFSELHEGGQTGRGLLCCRSTDAAFEARAGKAVFENWDRLFVKRVLAVGSVGNWRPG